MEMNLNNFSRLIIITVFTIFSTQVNSQSCTGINAGTPTTTNTCYDFDAASSGSSSSLCAGSGHGGSGTVRIISFCTNASNACVSFDFTGLSTTDGTSIGLYTGCSAGTLSGYIAGSGNCYGDQASIGWSSAGLTTASTCYYLRVWTKNAPSGTSTVCIQTDPATGNICSSGTIAIGTVATAYDNYCMTATPATDPTAATFCAGSLENNMWFSFTTLPTCTSPCTVTVTFSGISCTGGGQGFQIGYYTGTCGSLTNIGCTSGAGGTVTATITGLTPGQQIIVGLDGNAGAFCNFSVSATNVVPLPVELAEFEAKKSGQSNVELMWSTFTETDNDYFTIERSEDGTHFEFVNIIDGAGNSNTLKNYSIIDSEPILGTSFYRLKQTNYDGEYNYSQIKSVNIQSAEVPEITIYPNPTNEGVTPILSLVGIKDEVLSIDVFDITGKIIVTYFVTLDETGMALFELNQNLTNGVYLINVTNENGVSKVNKFVVR